MRRPPVRLHYRSLRRLRPPTCRSRRVCYTGNSHVRPMMQIIDDDGEWHGWVGVEASKGYDVQGDYIAVFRKADF